MRPVGLGAPHLQDLFAQEKLDVKCEETGGLTWNGCSHLSPPWGLHVPGCAGSDALANHAMPCRAMPCSVLRVCALDACTAGPGASGETGARRPGPAPHPVCHHAACHRGHLLAWLRVVQVPNLLQPGCSS
jgi:hypothetical protein